MRSTSTAWYCSASSVVPPRTASSADIPSAAPRWLTRSMKGPGNVFSRPTSSPMIFFRFWSISPSSPCSSGQVAPHHVLPVGPIVRPSGPDIEPHVDALGTEEVPHPPRVLDVRVVGTGGDHLRVLHA